MSANHIDMAVLDRDPQKLGLLPRGRWSRLQKLILPPRGWWSRNWKWFVPVLLLLVGGACGFALWYYGTVTGNESYRHAMEKIAAQPELKKSLGQSIRLVYWPPPHRYIETEEIDIRWEIIGSEEKVAKAHLKARLMNGKWEIVHIEIVLPEGYKHFFISCKEDAFQQ